MNPRKLGPGEYWREIPLPEECPGGCGSYTPGGEKCQDCRGVRGTANERKLEEFWAGAELANCGAIRRPRWRR